MKNKKLDYSKFEHLIKEHKIFWVSNGVIFERLGQPKENHYDLGLDPLGADACDSEIEMCRLFVGLIESIAGEETPFLDKGINLQQSTAMNNYFSSLDTGNYAYWSLVDFEEVPKELFQNVPLQKIPKIKYAVLEDKNDQIWIPFDEKLVKDDNWEQIEPLYLESGDLVSYGPDDDFPEMFTNAELEQKNSDNLDRVVDQFCKVLSVNGVPAASCEDLYELYGFLQ